MDDLKHFKPEDVGAFDEWVKANPAAYVFVIKSKDDGNLHRASCFHIQVYTGYKGKGAPKVAARRSALLRHWVEENGLSVSRCKSC